jgi:hypothetical protein
VALCADLADQLKKRAGVSHALLYSSRPNRRRIGGAGPRCGSHSAHVAKRHLNHLLSTEQDATRT